MEIKRKSLQRVISKIGNATLMTNLTTACGIAVAPYSQNFNTGGTFISKIILLILFSTYF